MTLCWSLDKLGPMTRIVEDAMLVLQAITGPMPATCRACRAISTSTPRRQSPDSRSATSPQWMKERPATDVDRAALETMQEAWDGR